jgi:hypothetical protein
MIDRNPERNFEILWKTFHNRYPFFELRNVDWKRQYERYRPKVTRTTNDDELFEIFSQMLDPLDDGHVELEIKASPGRKRRYFNPEPRPRFYRQFTSKEIKQLFKTTEKTLLANGFKRLRKTRAWMLRYCRSEVFGYMRILELEGITKRKLMSALDTISGDFGTLDGLVIDIRDNPGGDDDKGLAIINRFCDRKRIAFHRQTKIGPGDNDFSRLKTWHMKPQGDTQFTGPIVVLTCDSVFSGAEVFALAMRQLPHVRLIGDHTNGIFSYQLEKKLPNGWRYRLSYQKYFSADMICYEGRGVPADIDLLNKTSDIERGIDPLISRALQVLRRKNAARE